MTEAAVVERASEERAKEERATHTQAIQVRFYVAQLAELERVGASPLQLAEARRLLERARRGGEKV